MLDQFGSAPTGEDYARLEARWITREIADRQRLRRVDALEGREIVGRKRGDCAGLVISNIPPWSPEGAREYRLRLDHPRLEQRNGATRQGNRYLQPPDRPNLLFFPVGVTVAMLEDTALPLVFTEGEFKAMALMRLASWESDQPRFLPVAAVGVWSWKGTIGKTEGPNGKREDVHGPLPDMDHIHWKGRQSIIAFDADGETNPSVKAARWALTRELMERGAQVGMLEWPAAEGKGIDDRLAAVGPAKVLGDMAAVEFGDWRLRLIRIKGDVASCFDNGGPAVGEPPGLDRCPGLQRIHRRVPRAQDAARTGHYRGRQGDRRQL
jgi:hypothetical protein